MIVVGFEVQDFASLGGLWSQACQELENDIKSIKGCLLLHNQVVTQLHECQTSPSGSDLVDSMSGSNRRMMFCHSCCRRLPGSRSYILNHLLCTTAVVLHQG